MRVGRCSHDCVFAVCAHCTCHRRFLEQRKEISEKFAAEQDACLREAQEKHARELRLLQDRHRQHVVSLRTDLEARHQADVRELKAAFESEQRALSDTRVAELQTKHAADIRALETGHAASLDAAEVRHRSEVQALRDEHRRALAQLRAELEGQLPLTCDGELQSAEGRPRAEPHRAHQVRGPGPSRCRDRPLPVAARPGARSTRCPRRRRRGSRCAGRRVRVVSPPRLRCPRRPGSPVGVRDAQPSVLFREH